MTENDRSISTLHTLIGILRDGEKGFEAVGIKMREPEHRSFYLEESRVRSAFAAELQRVLEALNGTPVYETGTVFGQMHRLYADIRTSLATGDLALLNTTEMCERVVLRFYHNAIRDDAMPDRFLGILAYQAGHVHRVYELINDFRVQAQSRQRLPDPLR